MSDLSHFAFAMPTWLAIFLSLSAPAIVVGALWLLSRAYARVKAWANHKVAEALAPHPSVLDDFAAMGEQAENVAWIFGDDRPQFTVIDGGSGEAA